MRINNVYRYTRADGGITVSPIMPDAPYTLMYRVIADEGKEVSRDGENWVACADSEYADGWQERNIDDAVTEQDYQNALAEFGVNMNEEN